MLNLVNQMGDLNKKVDTIGNHHMEKLGGLGEKKDDEEAESNKNHVEGEDQNGEVNAQQAFTVAFHESEYAPRYHTNVRPQYHRREENPYFESYANQVDEARNRVRIEVHDFHGKLDPYAFQDWLTSLEDYFEWFGLAPARQVRFVKMKLKGQA